MKANSYREETTEAVGIFQAFRGDFDNPGDFKESEYGKQIHLEIIIQSGYFDGFKWQSGKKPEQDAYLIFLNYKHKGMVEVEFVYQGDNKRKSFFEDSIYIMREAAKKFFLVNSAIDEIMKYHVEGELSKKWLSNNEPEWETIEKILDEAKEINAKIKNPCDIESWYKVMTVSEARELFDFIDVRVKFPFKYSDQDAF